MQVTKKHHRARFSWPCWCFFMLIGMVGIKPQTVQAQAVSVSPSRLFFSGDAGRDVEQQVTISNNGKTAATFRASMMDWDRDSIGNKRFYAPGTRPRSNAAWVEVLPNVVVIPPGAKQQVTVTLHVPADVAAVNTVSNSMLFLTQLNEQRTDQHLAGSKATIGVVIKLEFGIHVYYTPTALSQKDIDFLAIGLQKTAPQNEKQNRVAVKIKNKGNVVTDGFLKFELSNKQNGDEVKIAPKNISMLPNDEQTVYLDLPASLQGPYVLVALLDAGEETNLKVAKKELVFN
jgi:hypothetical protein